MTQQRKLSNWTQLSAYAVRRPRKVRLKLIECHNNPCMNGQFFHLTCMNYKRKPNNAKTTWNCPNCSAANLYDIKTEIKVANSDSVKPSTCNSVSTPNNGY